MSFRLPRSPPIISLFHSPNVPASLRALELLQKAASTPVKSKPLDFDLEVVETQQPTADQIKTIMTYASLPSITPTLDKGCSSSHPRLSSFITAHPAAADAGSPASAADLARLVVANPQVLKYPLVVNWDDGEVSIGSVDGVKELIGNMQKRRDSELVSGSQSVLRPKGWFF